MYQTILLYFLLLLQPAIVAGCYYTTPAWTPYNIFATLAALLLVWLLAFVLNERIIARHAAALAAGHSDTKQPPAGEQDNVSRVVVWLVLLELLFLPLSLFFGYELWSVVGFLLVVMVSLMLGRRYIHADIRSKIPDAVFARIPLRYRYIRLYLMFLYLAR